MELEKIIEELPFVFDWVKYKGKDVVAQINIEASKKAGKPMFDISFCMTRAMNQVILKTVQFDKSKFEKSHLSDFNKPKKNSNSPYSPKKQTNR